MIILQFDDRYLRWGALMLRSLALHEPRRRVLADTVNLRPEQVTEVHAAHPQVQLDNDTVGWPTTTPAQMANRKPAVMQRVMDSYPNEPWYGLFDADFLVRRPLGDLWSLMDRHPAALIMTTGMWQGRYYRRLVTPSGIVLVRPDGRALIDGWAKWMGHDRPLEGIEPGEWFWDQLALLEAQEETPLHYGLIPIETFADCQLSPAGAIWSANVPGKDYYYALFQVEYQRQLGQPG